MNDTPLSDLAAEYEKSAELLQEQIDEISRKLKNLHYSREFVELTHKRATLTDMLYEVRTTALELRNYYNK